MQLRRYTLFHSLHTLINGAGVIIVTQNVAGFTTWACQVPMGQMGGQGVYGHADRVPVGGIIGWNMTNLDFWGRGSLAVPAQTWISGNPKRHPYTT
jgi:hypothetical protein